MIALFLTSFAPNISTINLITSIHKHKHPDIDWNNHPEIILQAAVIASSCRNRKKWNKKKKQEREKS